MTLTALLKGIPDVIRERIRNSSSETRTVLEGLIPRHRAYFRGEPDARIPRKISGVRRSKNSELDAFINSIFGVQVTNAILTYIDHFEEDPTNAPTITTYIREYNHQTGKQKPRKERVPQGTLRTIYQKLSDERHRKGREGRRINRGVN